VHWTALDGSAHTEEARVPPKTPAGSTVTVWTTRTAASWPGPLTEEEARLHAILGGVLAAFGAGVAVLGAACVVRLGLERHRMAHWTAEWERTDTRKGWKTG
jgi:hypothetical protein